MLFHLRILIRNVFPEVYMFHAEDMTRARIESLYSQEHLHVDISLKWPCAYAELAVVYA